MLEKLVRIKKISENPVRTSKMSKKNVQFKKK